MQVDYRPVGKNHRVVAVLELVDGKPAREISIRKYIRMLKKQAAQKDPLAARLKPLKNILREYLQANPEYSDRLRLQDGRDKATVQITDGKFVLKQLSLDDLRGKIAANESFVNVITYRQIAKQTENFKLTGSTALPQAAAAAPQKRDIEMPIFAGTSGGAREWFHSHAAITAACALLLFLAAVTFAVVRMKQQAVPLPSVDMTDAASVDMMIERCEATTRGCMLRAVEDPQGVKDSLAQVRRFLAGIETAQITEVQAKRVEAIRYRLDKLEGVAEAAQGE